MDAFARWLQDAAYDDALDSGIDQEGAWIVRRLALRVLRFPRLLDPIEVDTFCSGGARDAVYWAALEEELVAEEPAAGLAPEVEHRAPAGTGAAAVHRDGEMRWITAADGAVAATFRLAG